MDAIKWQRHNYIKFYAKMKIRIGGSHPMDINQGDEFEYDGSILKYAGTETAQPHIRGAIVGGWASTTPDDDVHIDAIVPSRSVAKSQTVNTDLGKGVQRHSSNNIRTSNQDENVVFNVADRKEDPENIKSQPKKLVRSETEQQVRGMKVQKSLLESQDAVTVGQVRTSSHLKVDVSSSDGSRKADELDNMVRGKPHLYKQNLQQNIEREGVTIKTNIKQLKDSINVDGEEGKVIAQVRNSNRRNSVEGIEIKDTSNPSKPKKVESSIKLSPKVRIAKAIDPNFPVDWSFEGKLAERLDRVKQHGTTQKFLEALYAAEGDQFRKTLEKEFPDQFGG